MKTIYLIIGILFISGLYGQDEDKRGEPVTLHVPASKIDGVRTNVIYPGCAETNSMMVSQCFTDFVVSDLQYEIRQLPEFDICTDIPTTLTLFIDKDGKVALKEAHGEQLTDELKRELTKAVSRLNTLLAENNKRIIPATLNNQPVEITKNIPFVIRGSKMQLVDNYENNGVTYHVFEKCNTYYIKDKSNLHTFETIEGKDNYEDYKKRMQEALTTAKK